MDSNGQYSSSFSNFPDQQGYSSYNNGGSSFSNGFAVPHQPQPPHYNVHRGSDPGSYQRHRQSQEDPLDLSSFDAAARTHVHNVLLENIIKPEQAQPWSGTQQSNFISRQLPQPSGHLNYPKTEPPPKNDVYSEAADSGYGTSMFPARSANQHFNYDRQELERNFQALASPRMNSYDNQSTVSESRGVGRSRDHRRRPRLDPCPVPSCRRVPKNQSDAKKHELTHTKPFRCAASGCGRTEGFATDNDLQRHRKSVHNLQPTVGSAVGYICAACTVPDGGPPKFWPRRDNFKAHIKRKHPNWTEDDLLERSKQTMRPDDSRTADDDRATVRSAMQSAAHHSQVDPDESRYHQRMNAGADLSRYASDQGAYNTTLWPNNSPGMYNPEDTLVGMQGHQADLPGYGNDSLGPPNDSNGLAVPSDKLNDFSFPPDAYSTSPAKKMKLTNPSDSFHDGFHRPQLPQIQLTPVESQHMSNSSGPQSAISPGSVPSLQQQQQGEWKCKDCSKIKKRECDLKKHMKRHTRPYGCTFPNCVKKFGSRNDWKRHESSQHFLQEMWKCQRPVYNSNQICARRPFYSTALLKSHLRGETHQMRSSTDAELEAECNKYRLGSDGFDRFWCGFCQQLIEQDPEGLSNAAEERFKHIGDHFDKQNCDSDNWVCIEANKKKQDITPEDRKEARRRARNGHREDADDEEPLELPDYNPDGMGYGMEFGGSVGLTVGNNSGGNNGSGTGVYLSSSCTAGLKRTFEDANIGGGRSDDDDDDDNDRDEGY